MGDLNLTLYRVVRISPTANDDLQLSRATVTATSAESAWLYLSHAVVNRTKGTPRARHLRNDQQEIAELCDDLPGRYQLVPEHPVAFDGTEAEWIQAIDTRAMPPAVVMPPKDELEVELEQAADQKSETAKPLTNPFAGVVPADLPADLTDIIKQARRAKDARSDLRRSVYDVETPLPRPDRIEEDAPRDDGPSAKLIWASVGITSGTFALGAALNNMLTLTVGTIFAAMTAVLYWLYWTRR